MQEKLKNTVAILLAASGIGAYYWLVGKATYVRLGAMFGCIAAALCVFWFSQAGRDFFAFAKDSVDEAKRVTWPTRKEAMQATGVVFAFVFVMALFLWGVDATLLWLTEKLLNQGA
jgi:preprotein translocase subunit SecE